ncbi:MAG: bifunctional metallophosphatase/5'-nucleotidase [Bacteroidales bacterium]|nr:bifunctional metallophosphatase/5'-nucleotidase [Bacteroidales bacterium]
MKRLLSFLFLVALLFSVRAQRPGDVVLLYENDVHCAVDGYPVLAGLRDSLQRMGCHVAVVSAGDFTFGGPIGAASKGEFVIRLMNAVGYDAACLGNHEFDYGFEQLRHLEGMLTTPLVCCNFNANSNVELDNRYFHAYRPTPFQPFVLRTLGGVTVAFVGVTTPTTMYTSNPSSFKDADGNFIYNFSTANLAATVQRSIDAARAAGAQVVVILSHLGDSDGVPTSLKVLSQLRGVDAVLDGHDHHIIPCLMVEDKDQQRVPLSSTGTLFQKVGMMVISSNPEAKETLCFKLFSTDSLGRKGYVNKAVADSVRAIKEAFEAMGSRVIANAEMPLVAEEGDIRVCRLRETNLGDLVADAYRVLMGADIGWVNGGGIRANVPAGSITHNQLFAVCPYNNNICVIRTSGKVLLDALETAVREYPKAEGCFAQVSGMTFTFDPAVPSGVVLDSNGRFLRVDGKRRVSNVKVGGEPLDLNKKYTIASTEYVLLKGGDAISFPDAQLLKSEAVSDLQILENYLLNNLHGIVAAPYDRPQGRILNSATDNVPSVSVSATNKADEMSVAPRLNEETDASGRPTVAPKK